MRVNQVQNKKTKPMGWRGPVAWGAQAPQRHLHRCVL
jgi:hypothetical protein